MGRRAWLVVLWLYALAAAGDFALHLGVGWLAGQNWFAPADLAVAFSASLFWPVDIIARLLLGP